MTKKTTKTTKKRTKNEPKTTQKRTKNETKTTQKRKKCYKGSIVSCFIFLNKKFAKFNKSKV